MPPLVLLGILILLTVVAAVVNRWFRRRDQAVYRQLAVDHKMHYSPGDPLRLTARVAARLPLPGAAAVRVIDLLYRTDEQTHYYVFTAEYTVGVLSPKHRIRRAAAFTESKSAAAVEPMIRLGSEEVSLVEQYRRLVAMTDTDR
jgi:hypothetical protein